jgi:TPR repeat protein
MVALMQDSPAPATEPDSKADTPPESSVPAPDAWLERRLRVFERALNALEAKADAAAQEQARTVARLEERLAAAAGQGVLRPVTVERRVVLRSSGMETPAASMPDVPPAQPDVETKPVPELPAIAPRPAISREEMADVLKSAREALRAAATAEPEQRGLDPSKRARSLTMGALSLVVLFLCIGLCLGKGALGVSASTRESDGVAHRQVARGVLARNIALADAGDARAQARLALAYLRGEGVASDRATALRWSAVSAEAGQPVAQYLLGAMYQQGDHVQADPARAFAWFASASTEGNLKAMHNLGIAYAQGLGTMKDDAKAVVWFTRAAERGYVDSAFDLAVLYERGQGVPQDLRQALKWYCIAAIEGDPASKVRAEFLRGQMGPVDVKLATSATMAFAPQPALSAANDL